MFELLAQDSQGGSSLVAFLPLLLMGGVFYFLLIRPQQRRARAQQALLRSVEVGDEIVTTAGVFGTIVAIDDETDVVTVEIAPGTQIRMVRAGIGRIVGDEDETAAIESGERDTEVPDGQDGPFHQT
ncbi:MAG TPA: preprotein translocase subunit YajC [Actinomycetota bacterium]|nr:preprotein translocase subunit YajC [Actinomycetota bacterium]